MKLIRILSIAALACLGARAAGAAHPNIVFVLADDLGAGDLGCYNRDSKVPTPNMDKLAGEGVRFTDAHSPSSVCTPTRYGVHRCPLPIIGLHANALRRPDRPLLLANAPQERRALGRWDAPDRPRETDRRQAPAEERLHHRRRRQVAPRLRSGQESRLFKAPHPGSQRCGLRLLLRYSLVARHSALPLRPQQPALLHQKNDRNS